MVEHTTCGGASGYDWSEHCCSSVPATNGRSGIPVAAPVESLQARMSATVAEVSNEPDVPTIARSFSHPWIAASRDALALSFES